MIKRFLKGKIPVVIIVGLLIFMLVVLVVITFSRYSNSEPFIVQSMFLDGEYSVDDGEWTSFDPEQPITDRFHTIRFRGKLTREAQLLPMINISAKNVWFSVESADGGTVVDHVPLSLVERMARDMADSPDALSKDEVRELREVIRSDESMELKQPDTPGYRTTAFRSYNWNTTEETVDITGDLVVTVWNPSGIKGEPFDECFRVYYTLDSGQYARIFQEVQPMILIFFAVLLFGIVFFPVAGFIQGKIDKYTWINYGSSYLPSDMNAAYLYAQLEIAEKINDARLAIWNKYYQTLKPLADAGKIELPVVPEGCVHNGHMFYAVSHYVPLHTAPAGQKFGRFHGEDKYTTKESERIVRLPMYYGLTMEQVDYICDKVKEFF